MISDLKILTLNVRGLNDKKKRQTVFYWLRKQDADIIALQETHLGRSNDEWKWSREWDGQSYWTVAAGNSKGVALLFNRKQKIEIQNVVKEQTGRLISLSVKIADKMIRLVCIYSPNNDNERVKYFKSKIENHMDPEQYNILLGDFNCTLKDEDRSGNLNRKEVGRDELVSLMKRQQLYDVFCKRHPDSVEYTYFKPNEPRIRLNCSC
jgi:exonuclease III